MKSKRRGFTLSECILALLICTLVALAVLGASSTTLDLNRKDYELSQASAHGRQLLDGSVDAAVQPGAFGLLQSVGYTFVPQDAYYVYRRDVTVQNSTLKLVSVSVYYASPTSSTPQPDTTRPNGGRILTMSTYVHG